jgi:hypothetical protein
MSSYVFVKNSHIFIDFFFLKIYYYFITRGDRVAGFVLQATLPPFISLVLFSNHS